MNHRRWFVVLGLSAVMVGSTALAILATPAHSSTQGTGPAADDSLHDWPMFHRDEANTGLASGNARMVPGAGPAVRWQYRVFDEPPEDNLKDVRWTSGFPLGDLDGDGTLEIVVTTPDMGNYTVQLDGQPMSHRVIALKDLAGQDPPFEVSWTYTTTIAPGAPGLDTYSPALVDADGDQLLDVVFTARDNYVRAIKGTTGELIWQFNLERITEAGPIVADVDGDHDLEVVVVTDCEGALPLPECLEPGKQAKLYVLPAIASGTNAPLWTLDYPYKMDSAEPAIADLDPGDGTDRKAIVAGTWGGELLVTWQDSIGVIVTHTLPLLDLDHSLPDDLVPVIRSSPLVWDFGEGMTAVFGWLPTDENAADARTSAVGLSADLENGSMTFTPRWTIGEYDTWKSSATLLPQTAGKPLVLFGYGLGVNTDTFPVYSDVVGRCNPGVITGGVVALDWQGNTAWADDYQGEEGNIRGSAATADLDGDGDMEAVIPAGCYGQLHAYDAGGLEEWRLQLGPRTQSSPSIGDLDGDGYVEIVLGSYDGLIWVLENSKSLYVPAIFK